MQAIFASHPVCSPVTHYKAGIPWKLCEPPANSATSNRMEFDGFKYLVYEMFVIWAAYLIRWGHWDLLGETLAQDLLIERHGRRAQYTPYGGLRIYVPSLDDHRNKRLNLNRLSVTSDLINSRLTQGPLAKSIPQSLFMDADYFLYLRSALRVETADQQGRIPLHDVWRPYSCLYLHHTPTYLARAQSLRFLEVLSRTCGITVVEFMNRIVQRCNQYAGLFRGGAFEGHFEDEDLRSIGSHS